MSARKIQGALAAAIRHHPDADHTDLRRQLAEAQLAEHIAKVVERAPRLTPEQCDRLAAILRGGAA